MSDWSSDVCSSDRTDAEIFETVGHEIGDPLDRALQDAAHDERGRLPHDAPVTVPHPDRADHVDQSVLVLEVAERDAGCGGRPLPMGHEPRDLEALPDLVGAQLFRGQHSASAERSTVRIGRASWWGRVCRYVKINVVASS